MKKLLLMFVLTAWVASVSLACGSDPVSSVKDEQLAPAAKVATLSEMLGWTDLEACQNARTTWRNPRVTEVGISPTWNATWSAPMSRSGFQVVYYKVKWRKRGIVIKNEVERWRWLPAVTEWQKGTSKHLPDVYNTEIQRGGALLKVSACFKQKAGEGSSVTHWYTLSTATTGIRQQ